jgi:hypothetical protein
MSKPTSQDALSFTSQRVNWRVDEFCIAHGIGRTLFYDEVKRGEIKIIKIGKRTLIPDNEAKAWQHRKAQASR